MVNIKGLNKALVLKALHDNSKVQGMSFIDLKELTLDDYESIISNRIEYNDLRFDYVAGKIIKCDLSGDEFDPYLYDRDNGNGTAQRAIDSLKVKE